MCRRGCFPFIVLIGLIIVFFSRPILLEPALVRPYMAGWAISRSRCSPASSCRCCRSVGIGYVLFPLPFLMTFALIAFEIFIGRPSSTTSSRCSTCIYLKRRAASRTLRIGAFVQHPSVRLSIPRSSTWIRFNSLRPSSISARVSPAIGMGIAALGVGNIFGNFPPGALRNPTASDGQFGPRLHRCRPCGRPRDLLSRRRAGSALRRLTRFPEIGEGGGRGGIRLPRCGEPTIACGRHGDEYRHAALKRRQ